MTLPLSPIASMPDPSSILSLPAQASFVEADLHYFETLDKNYFRYILPAGYGILHIAPSDLHINQKKHVNLDNS